MRGMRLLIVEDEYYTRQGIVDNLDFASLGIEEIVQADDGAHALEAAETAAPDIVISDVRMPRMDGIAMARALVKRYPACRFIFMSGFADREYLKAAIELKAVSFVDKPFRTPELREAVKAAVASCRTDQEMHFIAGAGAPLVQAEMALELVRPGADLVKSSQTLDALGIKTASRSPMTAVALRNAGDSRDLDATARKGILSAISREAARFGSTCAGAFTPEGTAAMVFFHPGKNEIDGILPRIFSAVPEAGLLAGVGAVVADLTDLPFSFSRACAALDAAFFEERRHAVCRSQVSDAAQGRQLIEAEGTPPCADGSAPEDFQAILDREDRTGAAAFLRGIAVRMRESGSTDAQGARDSFIGLFSRLILFAQRQGIDPFEPGESERILVESIARQGSLDGVLRVLFSRVETVFGMMEERRVEGGHVSEAKRFIRRTFFSPELSVSAIARAVGLSEAYVCRLFHEATGKTVHEYIAECRIERAKELLRAGRQIKMTEIAARAGFSDANYFAKAFRKATGVAPSEYRGTVTS
jgi:two-component system response regulator YesN